MNDDEARFAERLADDIERVLGIGIVIGDVELNVTDGTARVVATFFIGDRVETIEAVGADVAALYRPLIERAAELRLRTAFWQMVGPG